MEIAEPKYNKILSQVLSETKWEYSFDFPTWLFLGYYEEKRFCLVRFDGEPLLYLKQTVAESIFIVQDIPRMQNDEVARVDFCDQKIQAIYEPDIDNVFEEGLFQ